MKSTLGLCAGLMALASTAAMADHEVSIIRGGDNPVEVRRVEHHVHRGNAKRLTKVVMIEVEDRIVTAAKAYAHAMMPQHKHPIHVELVNENLYVWPDRDVMMQNYPHHRVNHNDLVPSAQRLGRDLMAGKATTVYGSPMMMHGEPIDMEPLMILDAPQGKAPKKVIPSVPAPPAKEKKPLVASAQ